MQRHQKLINPLKSEALDAYFFRFCHFMCHKKLRGKSKENWGGTGKGGEQQLKQLVSWRENLRSIFEKLSLFFVTQKLKNIEKLSKISKYSSCLFEFLATTSEILAISNSIVIFIKNQNKKNNTNFGKAIVTQDHKKNKI